jgi:hypothetical protein
MVAFMRVTYTTFLKSLKKTFGLVNNILKYDDWQEINAIKVFSTV